MDHAFSIISKKSLSNLTSQRFSSFFFLSFIFLDVMFRTILHFELIFIWCEVWINVYAFSIWLSNFFQHHLFLGFCFCFFHFFWLHSSVRES